LTAVPEAAVLVGIGQHGAPTCDIVEGDPYRVPHETRHARGPARLDERVDAAWVDARLARR
jgi:hypothetical protein